MDQWLVQKTETGNMSDDIEAGVGHQDSVENMGGAVKREVVTGPDLEID